MLSGNQWEKRLRAGVAMAAVRGTIIIVRELNNREPYDEMPFRCSSNYSFRTGNLGGQRGKPLRRHRRNATYVADFVRFMTDEEELLFGKPWTENSARPLSAGSCSKFFLGPDHLGRA